MPDGAVRIVDDVNTIITRDAAPSDVVLIAIKNDLHDRLEIPSGMIPAFPRDGSDALPRTIGSWSGT